MKKVILLWILLQLTMTLPAQSLRAAFVHYGPEQGLSHEEVFCILQDQRGLLWFGTSVGLNRFDGRRFEVFLPVPGDTTSLPGERITGLSQDSKGRMWVSTDRGLCWFDWQDGVFHRIPPADPEHTNLLRNSTVSRLAFDGRGCGWLLAGNTLVRLDLTALTTKTFPLPDGAAGPGQLTVDRRGKIWLTALLNTWRFDPDTGEYRLFLGRAAADPALHFDGGYFYEEEDGTFWASSWGAGLWRYDARRDTLVDFPDEPAVATCFLRDTLRGGEEVFWVGGGEDGLYLLMLPDHKIIRQRHNPLDPYSHNGTMVRDILRDSQTGIIWLATDKGIEKYDPHTMRFSREIMPVEPANQFLKSPLSCRMRITRTPIGSVSGAEVSSAGSGKGINFSTFYLPSVGTAGKFLTWFKTDGEHYG